MNVKFVIAKQAKEAYQYRNSREKLHKTSAAMWYKIKSVEKTASAQLYIHQNKWQKSTTPEEF